MKLCKHCGDTEWPCFVVDTLCRMCQARRRDENREPQQQLDAEIAEALGKDRR